MQTIKRFFLYISVISAVLLCACEENEISHKDKEDVLKPDSLITITILYTGDEHGWFEEIDAYDGAAGIAGLWKDWEGYDGTENYLILSGGDMWTGAAASTWFQGESMVDIMNTMEYDAAAIGNHEFDFKIDGLNQRSGEMNFPLLSANIIVKETGEIPSFAQPYIIKNINGIKVGIIGLSSLSTPYSTFPTYVKDYKFTSYADAINLYAPKAKNDGAKVLILISHLCENELYSLSGVAKANGISIMGGGHCHQLMAQKYNDIAIIGGGGNMKAYTKVEFNYNVTKDSLQDLAMAIVYNNKGIVDGEVKTIVDYWITQTDEVLSEVIGYVSDDINNSSTEMYNLVCDSWLYTFPDADVSITNAGGIRQNIFAGDITMGSIVGLLPFENTIVELELTGAQLKECIVGLIIGGMTTVNGYYLADGTAINDNVTYKVLTTDYLYLQTNINFYKYDDTPYYTSVHYRQPLIDWLKSIHTSNSDPLNNYLNSVSRW